MRSDLDESECESLEQKLHVFVEGFAEVANQAYEAIVNYIFKDLNDLFTVEADGLFSKAWEESPGDADNPSAITSSITATFADFLADLKKWVDSDYYFSKVLDNSLTSLYSVFTEVYICICVIIRLWDEFMRKLLIITVKHC